MCYISSIGFVKRRENVECQKGRNRRSASGAGADTQLYRQYDPHACADSGGKTGTCQSCGDLCAVQAWCSGCGRHIHSACYSIRAHVCGLFRHYVFTCRCGVKPCSYVYHAQIYGSSYHTHIRMRLTGSYSGTAYSGIIAHQSGRYHVLCADPLIICIYCRNAHRDVSNGSYKGGKIKMCQRVSRPCFFDIKMIDYSVL